MQVQLNTKILINIFLSFDKKIFLAQINIRREINMLRRLFKGLFKKEHTVCYTIKEDVGEVHIVRILNSYKDKSTAYYDLSKLLTKNITEDELLEKFTEKHIK